MQKCTRLKRYKSIHPTAMTECLVRRVVSPWEEREAQVIDYPGGAGFRWCELSTHTAVQFDKEHRGEARIVQRPSCVALPGEVEGGFPKVARELGFLSLVSENY